MNNKVIEPQISTMMVEISILRIGNNKMTISVFDQLYEEQCYDQFNTIKYPIWGKVNRKEGTYVIFQKNNELRKMLIPFGDTHYSFESSVDYSLSIVKGNQTYDRGYFLQSIRDIYKNKLSFINDKTQENIRLYPPIKNLHRVSFITALDSEELNMIQDEFNEKIAKTDSYNRMLHSLKTNSVQLFIAV